VRTGGTYDEAVSPARRLIIVLVPLALLAAAGSA